MVSIYSFWRVGDDWAADGSLPPSLASAAQTWGALIIILLFVIIIIIILIIIFLLVVIIIITRPKPAYGRQGLAGSLGQDTVEVSTLWVFLTSHFAPVALSSDLTNLGP